MTFLEATSAFKETNTVFKQLRNWGTQKKYWVIFADLIGFESTCVENQKTTLNNIVRFHMAVNSAVVGLETHLIKYQFTDACYIITENARVALAIASNIQNECLIHAYCQLQARQHPMFHEFIIPKVVISKGSVLLVNKPEDLDSQFKNLISSKDLLAGEGIVSAYRLEKKTTGGLVSLDKSLANEIKANCPKHRSTNPTDSLYKKWKNDRNNLILFHDDVIDIPWLALQPGQQKNGPILIEPANSFKEKLNTFHKIWKTSFSQHMSANTPTSTLKHYAGAIVHLCQITKCFLNKKVKERWDIQDFNNAMNNEF